MRALLRRGKEAVVAMTPVETMRTRTRLRMMALRRRRRAKRTKTAWKKRGLMAQRASKLAAGFSETMRVPA